MFWQCSEGITYELKADGGRLQGKDAVWQRLDKMTYSLRPHAGAITNVLGGTLRVFGQDHVRAEGARVYKVRVCLGVVKKDHIHSEGVRNGITRST